ncbi:MAG: TIGR03016 family PEP-CTERM system-associated outer membrane protein, partial [Gammaproteobacteria bacterium]
GYRFGRSLRLFVTGGREFNDFETDRDDDDGAFWLIGAGWAPTSVTNIDATYGERFFGNTGSLSVTHRSRRATYNLSYVDDISSTRGVGFGRFSDLADLLGLGVEEMFDQFTIEELSLLLALTGLDETVVTEGFFRTRNWRAGWTYDTGRSTFGVAAFHRDREAESRSGFGTIEDNRTQYGVNASWRWALGPRTDATFSTAFTRTEFEGDREDDLWNFRAGIGRDLGPDTRASLAYRHQRRDSNEAANEYRENGIVATVTRTF